MSVAAVEDAENMACDGAECFPTSEVIHTSTHPHIHPSIGRLPPTTLCLRRFQLQQELSPVDGTFKSSVEHKRPGVISTNLDVVLSQNFTTKPKNENKTSIKKIKTDGIKIAQTSIH